MDAKKITISDLINEIEKRVEDNILERKNADLIIKLINKADSLTEAITIAQLGTTYRRTGLHYDKRIEKFGDTIKYFRKNERLSFTDGSDKPHHKLIIGDNYEALLNLLIEYTGRIDVIYIDPPYGKDSMGEFANTNYNNALTRDNLLSMLYPRLVLAKQLLSDEGVIFCSIDDKNQAYVKCLFDEVFGEKNFISVFPKKGVGGRQDSAHYAIVHEYVLCYAKSKVQFSSGKIEIDRKYKCYDENKRLHYNAQLLRKWGDNSRRIDRPNLFYPIFYNEQTKELSIEKTNDELIAIYPMLDEFNEGCWRWGKETMRQNIKEGIVEVIKKKDEYIAYERLYETPEDISTKLFSSWIDDIDSTTGTKLLKSILPQCGFKYPKTTDLVYKLLQMSSVKKNGIVLDFFAGSGTTGHAVIDYNTNTNSKITFILCQSNEKTDEIPNGIAYDVTSKRLKRVMTGSCYDGTTDFAWLKDNEPYGGSLDVYEIESVSNAEHECGKTPFDVIDETLYGQKKFQNLKDKIRWVCENFENTQKYLVRDEKRHNDEED